MMCNKEVQGRATQAAQKNVFGGTWNLKENPPTHFILGTEQGAGCLSQQPP